MRCALAAEVRKQATLPTTWWATAGALGATVVLVVLLRVGHPEAPAEAVADLARGLIQAGAVAVGVVLGTAEQRQMATARLAVPSLPVWLGARWLVALSATGLVAAAMVIAGRVTVAAGGQWLGQWAWLWGVAMAAFLLAELTGSALSGALAVLTVLWIAPAVATGLPRLKDWLPDVSPLAGWSGVHPGVALGWLAVIWFMGLVRATRW
ncbi:hypothetical protein EII34_15405 [Arachnia propionica]|uniref:Uncharacterized protein n=1 Tax=Arachnia propionica TaxID=1750 RepID=A0A3P1T1A0_9ACTN|nr:hypothetical protein [Arachnia propionica]MDO5084427.1 hypothetical protein [Arachnia propionica]RRD03124.1 hypothetical protein EII34_15405 [Arachnia propionica]